MANLDSRSKRSSSVGILLVSILAPPLPDGAITAVGDRQHIAWEYSGIEAGAPAVAAYEVVQWRGETNTTESWLGETATAVRFRGETAQTDTFTGEV